MKGFGDEGVEVFELKGSKTLWHEEWFKDFG